jgi:hypothetical protein
MMVSLTITRKNNSYNINNNNSYNNKNKNKSKNNKTIKMIKMIYHNNQNHLFYLLMVIFMRY